MLRIGPSKFYLNIYAPLFTLIVAIAFLFGLAFTDALILMESFWATQEAYSYGYLVPVLSIYLIWQKRHAFADADNSGALPGVIITLAGSVLFLLGKLSTITLLVQYAFVTILAGLYISVLGKAVFRQHWAALVLLLFMVPLPQFLYQGISTKLQLVSSEIGVEIIRAFGISVFLQGNIIDLGQFKLQVVEACSGLRYLFPLMTFGFVCAYLFNAPIWQRLIILLSTVPITVLMNSFRIGVIGVMVEYWGQEMAEGFLHEFEGWLVFMVCVVILFLEMSILNRYFGDNKPFAQIITLHSKRVTKKISSNAILKTINKKVLGVNVVVLFSFVIFASFIHKKEEIIPERVDFVQFPLQIDEWTGRPSTISNQHLGALKLSDYLLVDYRNPNNDMVNLYVAYYASQREGQAAHSPRSCLPGDGWKIASFAGHEVETVSTPGSLTVNRVAIEKNRQRQLVYYWFQQRGEMLTNEYLVKYSIFRDSILKGRSDGALIRLSTPLLPGETWEQADERIISLMQSVTPKLGAYIPS
jgi:exosortase D (VPLPA-CTERM-specific)